MQVVTPKPEENVRAYLASSIEAKHVSSTFLVGLPERLYSKPYKTYLQKCHKDKFVKILLHVVLEHVA